MLREHACLVVLVAAGLASPCSAQTVLHEFAGDSSITSIAGGADWDADGHADLVLGFVALPGVSPSRVEARSGADGSLLWERMQGQAGNLYGAGVALVGDVDGDGLSDVLVSAHSHDTTKQDAGRVWLLSGADGTTIHDWKGDKAGDQFGSAVSAAGDQDGDGRADVWIGAAGANEGAGRVALFSGLSGELLAAVDGLDGDDALGSILADLGDLDGDGRDELATGLRGHEPPGFPEDWDSGAVVLFTGPQLARVATLLGGQEGDRFGTDVTGVGDLDGDGRPDFAVSALVDGVAVVSVHSGASLAPLTTLASYGSASFLAGVGDVDGDGHVDVVVGTPYGVGYETPGHVDVRSLATGAFLLGDDGDDLDDFGNTVAGVGDVDADGIPDWAAGGLTSYARVYSGRLRPVQAVGGSLAGDFGAPGLGLNAVPSVGSTVGLTVTNGPTSAAAFLIAGFSPAQTPFLGGTLVPAPDVVLSLRLGAAGGLRVPFDVPVFIPDGLIVLLQAWVVDATGPSGFTATAALSVLIP